MSAIKHWKKYQNGSGSITQSTHETWNSIVKLYILFITMLSFINSMLFQLQVHYNSKSNSKWSTFPFYLMFCLSSNFIFFSSSRESSCFQSFTQCLNVLIFCFFYQTELQAEELKGSGKVEQKWKYKMIMIKWSKVKRESKISSIFLWFPLKFWNSLKNNNCFFILLLRFLFLSKRMVPLLVKSCPDKGKNQQG